jgi:hypothetical protein
MQLRWTNVFNPGQDYRLVVCSPPLDLIFFSEGPYANMATPFLDYCAC